jgi:ferredoxin
MSEQLRVNPTACTGHGLCAELLPERVILDEWGYPVISAEPVPASLRKAARRAVTDCPALALMLTDSRISLKAAAAHAPSGHTDRRGRQNT